MRLEAYCDTFVGSPDAAVQGAVQGTVQAALAAAQVAFSHIDMYKDHRHGPALGWEVVKHPHKPSNAPTSGPTPSCELFTDHSNQSTI